MRKLFLLLIFFGLYTGFQFACAQNVGIGTASPAYPLTLQTPANVDSWGFMHHNGNVFLGSFIYKGGIAEFGTRSNHPLWFFTNNSDAPPAMAIDATGKYIGINTTNPQTHLDIYGTNAQMRMTDLSSSNAATISRYSNRLEIGVPDIFQVAMGTTANPSFIIKSNGYIGIGDNTPANRLQIGTTPGFSGNDLAIGNGTSAMSFFASAASNTWFSNNNFALMPNGGNGYVGIGTQHPGNYLQIGNIGSSGYGGNHIAFGNGTQASGIAQTNSVAQWYSTTDIAFMPVGNGHGRVGINTTSPRAPLEVDDFVQNGGINGSQVNTGYDYFKPLGYNGGVNSFGPDLSYCKTCTANVSILASDNIMALEVDVTSDARIKNIGDISNSIRDLETLNKIEVTNYTLKDRIRNGNKPFKKVIAQQVETVYPQVISTHTDFIPNVYRAASKITTTAKGLLLYFDSAHQISKTAARLKVLSSSDNTMNKVDIVSIPSANEVEIKADKMKGDKIFVYGEEVNDFRTVDYEGLTTLNISATQELSKRIGQQQSTIQQQNEKIVALIAKIDALADELNKFKNK
jgi:uncharacterized coiled-coil protein SlyX